MSKVSGNCLCGAVQYACEAEPAVTAVCHCENCQHQTGTAFSIIVGVPEASLVFEQDETLGEYLDQGESGGVVRRRFCKNCGSPIVSMVESVPGLAFIKAGTLKDKSWLRPTEHLWCESAQPWVEIDSQATRHDRNPS
jgi:hypothetical protein